MCRDAGPAGVGVRAITDPRIFPADVVEEPEGTRWHERQVGLEVADVGDIAVLSVVTQKVDLTYNGSYVVDDVLRCAGDAVYTRLVREHVGADRQLRLTDLDRHDPTIRR